MKRQLKIANVGRLGIAASLVAGIALLPVTGSGHAVAAASALELSISERGRSRTLSERNYLWVDGNMVDNRGDLGELDRFEIPYIQSSNQFTVSATFIAPPARAAGVEFVLTNKRGGASQSKQDSSAPYAASFTMPAMGEFALNAFFIDENGTRIGDEPAARIDPLGYGHIIVNVGESISSGKYGDEVAPGTANYPVTSAERSPSSSPDKRNFFQYENSEATAKSFYRGYHPTLNSLLTTCSGAPVFLLNEGFGALRTGRDGNSATPGSGKNNMLAKMPDYTRHIQELGASYILLEPGTNDISQNLEAATWGSDLQAVVDGLQQAAPRSTIWIWKPVWRSGKETILGQYNQQINNLIAAEATQAGGQKVLAGPDFTGFFKTRPQLYATGDAKTIHPNQAGYEEMARLWSETICDELPVVPTATPTTATPTTTTPTTTTPTTATPTSTTPTTATPVATTVTPTTTPGNQPERQRVMIPLLVR